MNKNRIFKDKNKDLGETWRNRETSSPGAVALPWWVQPLSLPATPWCPQKQGPQKVIAAWLDLGGTFHIFSYSNWWHLMTFHKSRPCFHMFPSVYSNHMIPYICFHVGFKLLTFRDVPLLRPYPPVTCAAEFGFRQNSWIRMGRLSQMWYHSVDWSIQTLYPNESKSRCKGWGDRGDHKKSKTDSIESLISSNRMVFKWFKCPMTMQELLTHHTAPLQRQRSNSNKPRSPTHTEKRVAPCGTMWHHVAPCGNAGYGQQISAIHCQGIFPAGWWRVQDLFHNCTQLTEGISSLQQAQWSHPNAWCSSPSKERSVDFAGMAWM